MQHGCIFKTVCLIKEIRYKAIYWMNPFIRHSRKAKTIATEISVHWWPEGVWGVGGGEIILFSTLIIMLVTRVYTLVKILKAGHPKKWYFSVYNVHLNGSNPKEVWHCVQEFSLLCIISSYTATPIHAVRLLHSVVSCFQLRLMKEQDVCPCTEEGYCFIRNHLPFSFIFL